MAIGGVATNVACNVGDLGWEGPLGEGMATHSSILAWRVPMDRGARRATDHGVAKSRTRLSDESKHTTVTIVETLRILFQKS